MKKRLEHLLETAGLKPEEAQIYICLLTLKAATIPQLISKLNFGAMMAYRTVNRLVERGLVKSNQINNKQNIYSPLPLSSLIRYATKEREKFDRLARAFQGIEHLIPMMDISQENENNELIEIYEGIEKLREVYLEIPEIAKEEFLHIGSVTKTWDILGMDFDCAEERSFIKRRMSRGVHARVFNEYNKEAEEFVKSDNLEKRTTRLRKQLPVMNNYLIINDNQSCLFINDLQHPKVIRIKQPDLLEIQKQQFYNLWQSDF